MIRNPYFKTTMGIFAQLAIAVGVDASDGTGIGSTPGVAQVLVTIAASPTAGETITITVDGIAYLYTVPVSGTTQQAHDGILGMLQANTQGFYVGAHSGTTSSVYNLYWPGAAGNAKAISLVEVGTSFTVAGPYTFAGGVNSDATAADSLTDFIASGTAGAIWAFWEDTKLALAPGDTYNPANSARRFFYAWKQGTVAHISTPIPVSGRIYSSAAYNAGVFGIRTATYTGTHSATQIINFRIIEDTATMIPYPSWTYSILIGSGGINQAVTDLAAAINAEADDPIVSASASTNVLTVTATNKLRTFTMTSSLETSASQPSDLGLCALAYTVKSVAPIGDLGSVQELEKYYIENNGGTIYTPQGILASEFGLPTSNILAVTQWGFLMVTSSSFENGVVRNYSSKNYIVIAVPTGVQATLAAL